MLPAEILRDYEKLPNEAQRQVINFIEFMKARYQEQKSGKNSDSIESSFDFLTTDHSASLEEMYKAIESEGGQL